MARLTKDGPHVRARYTKLKLRELSSVDKPAQIGARALCMKRADDDHFDAAIVAELAKYVCETDGAHSFSEVLRENEFSQKIWPCVDAFSQSIRSIVGDSSITGAEREGKIAQSTSEFLAAVRAISPDAEKLLSETIRKEDNMADENKVAELTRKVEDLTGQLTSATTLASTEKSRADTAESQLATEKTEHAATKQKLVEATDEMIKVDETEVRKSAVGETQFAVTKALVEKAEIAEIEKRVERDFKHVPGTVADLAKGLRHIEKLAADDPARKALEGVLSAAEKMAAGAFDSLGHGHPRSADAKKAEADFMAKVDEIQKRDDIKRSDAMSKARDEHPALFEAYQSGGAVAVEAN
jgi:hypothetical protein